jgi:hypothetical protein
MIAAVINGLISRIDYGDELQVEGLLINDRSTSSLSKLVGLPLIPFASPWSSTNNIIDSQEKLFSLV